MSTRQGQFSGLRASRRMRRIQDLARAGARRLRANPNMLLGTVILTFVCVIAMLSPVLTRSNYERMNPVERLQGPSSSHWFGTDDVGRDVYDGTILGSRISLFVGASVAGIATAGGMAIGLVAGYYRRLDNIIMRLMDALMAFPGILLALALVALFGGSIQNVILALCVTSTPSMARLVRGVTLSLREMQYVEAAEAIGVPAWRILFVHIAPNTLAVVMVQATFILASSILSEATLSFLGAGVPSFIATWGNMIANGKRFLRQAFWISLFPGISLSFTVLGINLVGDGLRDALDPKLRRRF